MDTLPGHLALAGFLGLVGYLVLSLFFERLAKSLIAILIWSGPAIFGGFWLLGRDLELPWKLGFFGIALFAVSQLLDDIFERLGMTSQRRSVSSSSLLVVAYVALVVTGGVWSLSRTSIPTSWALLVSGVIIFIASSSGGLLARRWGLARLEGVARLGVFALAWSALLVIGAIWLAVQTITAAGP